MREILFRGKTATGKWVYGDLIHYVDKPVIKEVGEYWVIPETVGQYTGLTDKNGKKIFEGDIVKYKHITNFFESEDLEDVGNKNPDKVIECNGIVKWIKKSGCFSPVPERYDCDDCWYSNGTYDFEVIGNIHEKVDKNAI